MYIGIVEKHIGDAVTHRVRPIARATYEGGRLRVFSKLSATQWALHDDEEVR